MTIDSSVNADVRVYTMRKIKSAGIKETIRWFYPPMIKVHEWLMQNDKTRYPLERLSYEKMDLKGIYWIGKNKVNKIRQSLISIQRHMVLSSYGWERKHLQN